MSQIENYFLVGGAVAAAIGAMSDVRTARMPNWLTYSSLLIALATRTLLLGLKGVESGVLGALAAGGLFFFLFLLGGMGGGDVKMMAASGAWVGSKQVLPMLIAAALAGGVLAIVFTVFGGRIRATLRNLWDLIWFHLHSGLTPHPVLNVGDRNSARVPFGVAIAFGTFYCAGNAIWWR